MEEERTRRCLILRPPASGGGYVQFSKHTLQHIPPYIHHPACPHPSLLKRITQSMISLCASLLDDKHLDSMQFYNALIVIQLLILR